MRWCWRQIKPLKCNSNFPRLTMRVQCAFHIPIKAISKWWCVYVKIKGWEYMNKTLMMSYGYIWLFRKIEIRASYPTFKYFNIPIVKIKLLKHHNLYNVFLMIILPLLFEIRYIGLVPISFNFFEVSTSQSNSRWLLLWLEMRSHSPNLNCQVYKHENDV